MKNNKKTSWVIIVLLLVVGVTSGYVASTYAKYTSDLGTKNGTATIAKWAFSDENSSRTLNLALDQTYDPDTLSSGKIAPGTSGSFSIELSNVNAEVAVNYELAIGTATNKPTNLKFYSNSNHTTELVNNKLTGTLAPGAAATTKTIYWQWAYETTNGDAADNTAGEGAATNASMTIPITITGTQAQPQ